MYRVGAGAERMRRGNFMVARGRGHRMCCFCARRRDMPIIEVERLAKTFRTRDRAAGLAGSLRSFVAPHYREREAVKHISFSLEPGEILAFIGPNGAGKSTTIKMLTGILYPSDGKAHVLGLTPWQQRRKLAFRIASVFGQKSQLWYHLPPQDTFGTLYTCEVYFLYYIRR